MNNRNSIYTLAFTLTFALVAGCDAEQSPISEDSTTLEIELAEPQPKPPVCSRCLYSIGSVIFSGDDTLSIDIDNSYNGYITNLTLTTWDAAGTPSYHYFAGSGVISDINDPSTEVTLVYVEGPTAVTAQLSWTHTGGSQNESISVN